MARKLRLLLLGAFLVFSLWSCGQKGELYIPKNDQNSLLFDTLFIHSV